MSAIAWCFTVKKGSELISRIRVYIAVAINTESEFSGEKGEQRGNAESRKLLKRETQECWEVVRYPRVVSDLVISLSSLQASNEPQMAGPKSAMAKRLEEGSRPSYVR